MRNASVKIVCLPGGLPAGSILSVSDDVEAKLSAPTPPAGASCVFCRLELLTGENSRLPCVQLHYRGHTGPLALHSRAYAQPSVNQLHRKQTHPAATLHQLVLSPSQQPLLLRPQGRPCTTGTCPSSHPPHLLPVA
jgi:hypothetical protein